MTTLKLLYICADHPCPAMMAAGLTRELAQALPDYLTVKVDAACLHNEQVHPMAAAVMAEQAIDIAHPRPMSLDGATLEEADLLITLGAGQEAQLVGLPKNKRQISWPLELPSTREGAEDAILLAFRALRDELRKAVSSLLKALLVDHLDAVRGSVYGRLDVEVLSHKRTHEGFVPVNVVELRHRLYGGGWSEKIQREVTDRPPAVGVLLFDPDRDEVVLVKQFRVGALENSGGPWMLEIVAGIADGDEDIQAVARREALEEANCKVDELVPICSYFNSPGWSDEKIHLFCARVEAAKHDGIHGLDDEHEDILVVKVSREQAQNLIVTGEINNAMAVIAIQWLQLNHEALASRWQA